MGGGSWVQDLTTNINQIGIFINDFIVLALIFLAWYGSGAMVVARDIKTSVWFGLVSVSFQFTLPFFFCLLIGCC